MTTPVQADWVDVARIRAEFLKQAVLWVCELAAHDRLEARNVATELRQYFESVVDKLPLQERRDLREQINLLCAKLADFDMSRNSA